MKKLLGFLVLCGLVAAGAYHEHQNYEPESHDAPIKAYRWLRAYKSNHDLVILETTRGESVMIIPPHYEVIEGGVYNMTIKKQRGTGKAYASRQQLLYLSWSAKLCAPTWDYDPRIARNCNTKEIHHVRQDILNTLRGRDAEPRSAKR